MVWVGHGFGQDKDHNVCLWYSDDGGKTYTTTDFIKGAEASITEVEPGLLLLNGRAGSFSWAPNRTRHWSTDNGASWGHPQPSPLLDVPGCEASLINVQGILYSSEPRFSGRRSLRVSCSRDRARTWPFAKVVNGNNSAAYSDLVGLSPKILLAVYEDDDRGNLIAMQVDTSWCLG